jgi:hypothetical protein
MKINGNNIGVPMMKEVEREREKSRQMWIKNCAKSKERREKN